MLKACANNPLTAEGNPHARTHAITQGEQGDLDGHEDSRRCNKGCARGNVRGKGANGMRVHKPSPHCTRVVRLHQPNNRDIDAVDDIRDDIEDQVNGMEREPPCAHSSCSRQHCTPTPSCTQMAIADEIGEAISNPIGGGLDDVRPRRAACVLLALQIP